MQAPPSQDEMDLYNEYWNTLSGNSNTQVLPENIIVNFYKASNLNNQCLEEIWRLSNPNNVKSISKAEFFLGVRLIALAQKGYNVSNIPMNITIPQPRFMGYENVLMQFQNKKMLKQQPTFNNVNTQQNLLQSSFMVNNNNNRNKIYSFSNNTSPVEWFIRQAKRIEYTNIFEKFQKNNVFHHKSLQELVKDEPVNENDLDKIWALLDKYNIKVIRKAQFIIFMHILESCKSGDAIPMNLPYSIIQSVGAEKEMEDRTVPDYKKKYLENLKSDISKLQVSIDNLNNNKYSNPSIYTKLEDLIQNLNNETSEINKCKQNIQ
ncbi:hypothetical protein BCR32DRAFT_251453 [Anaeromyces robustus]|uniref:EH domain-containing protein n=1 Tax=Anaeromyces robustus TaxID=1754192 RepID=A0A1Y1VQZ9_9FUNG|nr:hypothetical protein BCR32DRAFT_251453 [Anaeromyces robustus]|eukprot:ORX63721.1 hypothetical protein BCR32DRAFT_251453 [Anaeromyces robustus]